ncbi:DNA polymerase III subunit delta [Rhizobium sp. RU36D]|uniref:DNA polymerase III subunit delta n=1 Tax=Rhizobium sp. RU36D TaxID=1907415 RepID=UPI0009D862D8|nr:DNA polymerase III subunit delta [Rhizobium sp. RU36D]SMC89177.1 DNA polymerase III, delta subunit [Rhizobium sp. RU36D]
MTEIKSHEFDQFRQRSRGQYRLFVFYGPDQGLISERAAAIASNTGVALDDPFSLVRLDASDIQSDPGRLADEVNSVGLFGGEKLIWIKGAGADKRLADALEHISATEQHESYVIIEAGDLKKGAALRKIGETSRNIAIVACYSDDARSLNALIDAELSEAGLAISPAARALLIDSLGGDRIASRNEIRKLALYCRGMPSIEREHVVDIVGDASAISVDEAVDAVMSGKPDDLLHAMQKIASSKTSVFLVLQNCMRQFQQLEAMAAEMQLKKLQPSQVMQTLGRGIHFRRKPVLENALRTWPPSELAREARRLQATILQTRQRQALEDTIALQSLLSTTLHAARFNRRAG